MTNIMKDKLEKAAEYIIKTSAVETTSGSYYFYPCDMPPEILPQSQYMKHLNQIIEIMREYGAVADAEANSDGVIDVNMYLDYCRHYEPDRDEEAQFPDDRAILDPLTTRRVPERDETPSAKVTLTERLEEGKRKAALHERHDGSHINHNREAR